MAINITLRSTKGSALTASEVDANFVSIKDNLTLALAGTGVTTVNGRTGAVTLTGSDITNALGFTPSSGGGSGGVSTFNSRTGAVTLTGTDVVTALGYTPGTTGTQAAGSVGQVSYFPTTSAPTGWLVADGAAVSRTTYSLLFGLVGTMYGAGDGSTTFNLPDLRGEFVRGLDLSRGVDAGRTIGSFQAASVGNHAHGFQHVSPHANGTIWATGDDPGGNDGSTISVTGSQETRPRNIALLPCICALPMASGATGPAGPAGATGPAGSVSTVTGSVGSFAMVMALGSIAYDATVDLTQLFWLTTNLFGGVSVSTIGSALSGTWKSRGCAGLASTGDQVFTSVLIQRVS